MAVAALQEQDGLRKKHKHTPMHTQTQTCFQSSLYEKKSEMR